MTRTLIALWLALSATSALAQDYNRQDLVRGLCQKDGCDEFTILAADRVRTTDEGTLFRTRLQTFHASYGGRQERGQETGYVFCSPTRPAIMAEQNGQTMAFYLAPFATQESRENVRKNANFHALYFAICHGREAGKAAVHNLAGVAQSHGYRVALAQSKLVPLNRAEDVLTMADGPSERAPVEGRRDARQDGPPLETMPRDHAPMEARRFERLDRPPVEAWRSERLSRNEDEMLRSGRWDRASEEGWRQERPEGGQPWRQAPPRVVENNRAEEGLLSGARRWTNRALDALSEVGYGVTGSERD